RGRWGLPRPKRRKRARCCAPEPGPPAAQPNRAARALHLPRGRGAGKPPDGGVMRKILIVEDDPNVASLVRELLLEEGFIAVHSPDIDSGWASLIAEDP